MGSSAPVIAEQSDVTHGVSGFYSLRLLRQGPTSLVIEVALSIYFDFVANDADASITWTQAERDAFTNEWQRQVPGAWNQDAHTSYGGYDISLIFTCDIRTAAAATQWQARVMKLEDRNTFRTSAVWRNGYAGGYDAKFDSNDDLKKALLGDGTQTAMIHEFGHMIGNPDEYKSGSAHYADKESIMNIGSAVRDRHLEHLVDWAKPHIDALP